MLVLQPRAWCLAGAQSPAAELTCGLHLRLNTHAAQSCPVEILVLSFSGKRTHAWGSFYGTWHLRSTWIPCQASCICGFIEMPSMLLLEAPALSDPSAWNLLPPAVCRALPSHVSAPLRVLPLPPPLPPAHPSPSTLLCVSPRPGSPCAMPCV